MWVCSWNTQVSDSLLWIMKYAIPEVESSHVDWGKEQRVSFTRHKGESSLPQYSKATVIHISDVCLFSPKTEDANYN